MSQRNINRSECEITQAVEMAQMHMFDLAYRKYGFSRKVLHLETGMPLSTIKAYEEGTAMPIAAFVKVAAIKDFPNELLSLVLDVGGKSVADSEADETDLDDAVIAGLELALKWAKARHPESPSGVKIDHTEKPGLHLAAAGLADRIGKVA